MRNYVLCIRDQCQSLSPHFSILDLYLNYYKIYEYRHLKVRADKKKRLQTGRRIGTLKVPKREIFERSDFPDFYTMKSLRVGDFGVKIKKY